jgi:hypothetical protein
VSRDLRGHRVSKDCKENKVSRDLRGQQDRRAIRDHRVSHLHHRKVK